MSGSTQPVTQQTKVNLSPEQQSLLQLGMPFAQTYANQGGTTLPDFSPVAQFTDPQKQGQQKALEAADQQQGEADSAAGAQKFLTSGAALDPATNPGLAKAIKFAQLPVQQNLEERTLPALRSEATGVGQFGSSRDQIAQGLAARGAEQAEGSIAANMTNANYQHALEQMTKAMGLTPTVQGASTIPATTTSGVGDVQQALNQANLGYEYQKGLFPQENLLATAQALSGIAAGIPGAGATSAGTLPGRDALSTALGLGTLGMGLFGSNSPFGAKGAFSSFLPSLWGSSMPTDAAMTGTVDSSMAGIDSLIPGLTAADASAIGIAPEAAAATGVGEAAAGFSFADLLPLLFLA